MLSRFAPSPTGLLHLGNIRSALICYLYTRSNDGKIILRIDDTDSVRSKQEYVDRIQEDFAWLNFEFAYIVKQSDRLDRYKEIIDKLKAEGRIYPCYETEKELELKRKSLLNMDLPPIYNRSDALNLTEDQKMKFESEGRAPYWRYKLDNEEIIRWEDEVRSLITFNAENIGDPVVIRANGNPTYMLPSTIDDIDMNITHIVRGEDHISNTAIQIQIMKHLGATIPKFAHISLLQIDGKKISKTSGGFDLCSFRNEGIEAMTINNCLINIGVSKQHSIVSNMDDLIKEFDIKNLSRSKVNVNVEDIYKMNHKLIQKLTFKEAKESLLLIGIADIEENFWQSVKYNIDKMIDVKIWKEICCDEVDIQDSTIDKEFIKISRDLLPKDPWDEGTWNVWISSIKSATKKKGKELFMPIRKALTGKDNGPEMVVIFLIIGYRKVYDRLSNILSGA